MWIFFARRRNSVNPRVFNGECRVGLDPAVRSVAMMSAMGRATRRFCFADESILISIHVIEMLIRAIEFCAGDLLVTVLVEALHELSI